MWNCHYHPDTQLQNFCTNAYCSLPMCPKCIHIHLHDLSQQHHVLPLNEVIQMTKQQILTCIQGLTQQKEQLEGQYNPQQVLANYDSLIQKYKTQTINSIDRYYQSLKEQLLMNLTNIYNETLAELRYPIQQKIDLLQRYVKKLQNQPTLIETLITVNSESEIQKAQSFFTVIREKKNVMASLLPRLEVQNDGKLGIPLYPKTKHHQHQITNEGTATGMEKILGLQDRLLSLRQVY